MRMHACENCGKVTGHKRAFGIGTFIACLVTGGIWLVALPFYPIRCMICGNQPTTTFWEDLKEHWVASLLALTIIFFVLLSRFSK